MANAGYTVFVVDDDESVRKSMRRLLKSVGFTVATFASAQEYLDCSQHHKPHLLVLDVRMPGLSGLDLQKHLVAAGMRVPILFVTAREDLRGCRRAMKAGAVPFLQKPVDAQQLFDAIDTALGRLAVTDN
jgi:FixJ family two-component response regulator